MAVQAPERPASALAPMLPEPDNATKLEQVVVEGNLASLTPIQRVSYYRAVCESVGLNPLTKPFEFITLNGKLTLYARREATDQLRAIRGIQVTKLERERADDLAIVIASGVDRSGRLDSALGAVAIRGLQGEALANALMKAETKAKRRLTLSLSGLGMLDEIEVETVPGGWKADVDEATGEIAADSAKRLTLEERIAEQAKDADYTEVPPDVTGEGTPPVEVVAAPEGSPSSSPAPAAQCEATSPYEGNARCRQIAGHEGMHKSSSKESWS